jgi:hypothetical protein
VGFAAGGSAGKASEEAGAARIGPRDAGREVGGVGRAELEPDVIFGVTHDAVPDAPPRPEGAGLGKPGNPFAELVEAEPHDAFRDAEERELCAVEDLSLRTRDVDFDCVFVETLDE